jgi:hypothetical protein
MNDSILFRVKKEGFTFALSLKLSEDKVSWIDLAAFNELIELVCDMPKSKSCIFVPIFV